jgi:hypothetical protein
MTIRLWTLALASVTLLAVCGVATQSASAVQPDLFANYYAKPGAAGGIPAQMYLSPVPVPPLVGHTFVTYQPFEPHEQLYKHERHYYRYYPDGGFSTTKVRWW